LIDLFTGRCLQALLAAVVLGSWHWVVAAQVLNYFVLIRVYMFGKGTRNIFFIFNLFFNFILKIIHSDKYLQI